MVLQLDEPILLRPLPSQVRIRTTPSEQDEVQDPTTQRYQQCPIALSK